MSKNIGNTIYDRSINYYETDQMGIVHHSNYIRYFEAVSYTHLTLPTT